MNASLIVLALMDGVSYAALLFIVALGLTLIFGVMRILNIAHGSLYAWGGYFAATLGLAITRFGLPSWLALPALFVGAILIGGLLGTILEWALLRRILDKDPILQLLVTFAAFMVLEDLQRMIWGVQPIFVSDVVNQLGTLSVAGVTYTRYQLLVLPLVALAAFFGLRWFLGRTALGRQVTAVTHHREVATAMGVNVAMRNSMARSTRRSLRGTGGRRIHDQIDGQCAFGNDIDPEDLHRREGKRIAGQ